MNSLRLALVPGLIAGVVSIFTSWFWVACVFHRHQRQTPETWQAESTGTHIVSSAVQIATGIATATMYVMVARGHAGVLGEGMLGAIRFAIIGWLAFGVPILLSIGLYVRLHPLVVAGLLLNWLTTALLASTITAWWIRAW